MGKTFVLSVGGSLLMTAAGLDISFIKRFRKFILDQVRLGHRFYLVVGGGLTARSYARAALSLAPISNDDRDLVGIEATRLNAQLIRVVLGRAAHPSLLADPNQSLRSRHPVVVAAGFKPGYSTDYIAVLIAQNNGVARVINLSNIDYAYAADPRLNSAAEKLVSVTWPAFRRVVGSRWQPGLNVPFDPVASRRAAQGGLEVVILNGRKLKNLANCLQGGKYHGTTIS